MGEWVVLIAVNLLVLAAAVWAWRWLVRQDQRLKRADECVTSRPLQLPWESETVSLSPPPAKPRVAGVDYEPDTAVMQVRRVGDEDSTVVIRRPPVLPVDAVELLDLAGANTVIVSRVKD